MAKSKAAEEMDELQSQLRPFLQERGFRMRSRTCNRITSDGLTHVINFQMGRFDPPGTSYIPWFRKNLYGKFTVNVGVYVPEVADERHARPAHSFVREPYCCLRERLGNLSSAPADRWWNVRADRRTAAELRLRLERDACPFLARFESRDDLLQGLGTVQETWGTGGPPLVICAIILAHRGQIEMARQSLITQVRKKADPKHTEYVQALADRLGLGRIDS